MASKRWHVNQTTCMSLRCKNARVFNEFRSRRNGSKIFQTWLARNNLRETCGNVIKYYRRHFRDSRRCSLIFILCMYYIRRNRTWLKLKFLTCCSEEKKELIKSLASTGIMLFLLIITDYLEASNSNCSPFFTVSTALYFYVKFVPNTN